MLNRNPPMRGRVKIYDEPVKISDESESPNEGARVCKI